MGSKSLSPAKTLSGLDANDPRVGPKQCCKISIRRTEAVWRRRPSIFFHEVREASDQSVVPPCTKNKATPMRGRSVVAGDQPVVGLRRKLLKAADARGRRQVCERFPRADTGDGWRTQQARNQTADRYRPLGHFDLADIVDASFEQPCRCLY